MDKEYRTGEDAVTYEGRFRPSLPVTVRLVEKRRETTGIVSLLFEFPETDEPSFRPRLNVPGQFVMVWLPGMDEKPYVISYLSKAGFGITVAVRGDFSRRLSELKEGQKAGFRGPLGRGFSGFDEYEPERIAIMGGGCGMAPLALLAQKLPEATLIQGAPTSAGLLYMERFPHQIVFTEDGSSGIGGTPVKWLQGRTAREFNIVYTCGPEAMLKAVVGLCIGNGLQCQAALERYMKCGIGVCGQCDCDGRLVCADGPVFTGAELAEMPSFGTARRDAAGRRIPIVADGPVPYCERAEG